ncbi:membrane protein insertase YidC [Sphingomonas sp. KRR8]|uniref:membrane protein insertase YidC n=1 Tax=Sphingomonas sp. KRR8 TaxID=2942996 RepID=UPI00202026CD|nr:membrane protein insertase YidC [Sphingomonas sp. KRR8]URD61449.1 membrane protein insertase YidC [Sphingomonas sp. KRR8]
MNDSKNMILAVVLSALVLIGWTTLSERFFPQPKPAATQTAPKAANGQPAPAAAAATAPAPTAAPALTAAQALNGVPRLRIATPSLEGSISLKGARFDDLRLVRHAGTQTRDASATRLLSPAGAPGAYFASFGWLGQGVQLPDANTVWQASAPVVSPNKPVTLSWTNPTGQRFELLVSVDDGYLFTVAQKVANGGSGPVALRPYGLISRAEKSADPDAWTHHVGPMSFLNGAANYGINYKTLDEAGANGEQFSSNGGWLGFTDKYWLTALAPVGDTQINATLRKAPTGAYQADYALSPTVLAPGQAMTSQTRLFAGAKEKEWLDRYETQGLTKISKSIDWGWFEWFMRPIFNLLLWLFHALGNFGLAIIALVLIVRGIMYPIFDKQFRSMASMRRLQPLMKELQERHKDDRSRLQQETMDLYKREKINPAAGCLPMFLQIPVFYALYKVLTVSVEMRHQPFVGWIKDLSAPDPLTPVNLFGLLPFDPPGMLHLGVLPILLGFTMWLQFRLNPAPMDPVQKQIFSFMPIVMTFVMAPFATGLQLYWIVSNILGIAQQKYLYRKYDTERLAAKAVVSG